MYNDIMIPIRTTLLVIKSDSMSKLVKKDAHTPAVGLGADSKRESLRTSALFTHVGPAPVCVSVCE